VLLWRRSDNLVFALLLGGAALVGVGDGVECRVRGILQVVDETDGPSTKREYAPTTVPAGPELAGHVVDFLGRPLPDAGGAAAAGAQPLGGGAQVALLNGQPDMESREQISEPLVTGVKAIDLLTPLGRGQALQVSGPRGSGKTQLCIDAVMGQRGAGVRCVYAAVGAAPDQLARTVGQLRAHGCMEYTTVVAATADRPLGEQYAAMLAACSMAEATRDAGGHALVVLNDVSVMVRVWEKITVALVGLGTTPLEADADALAVLAEQTTPTTPTPTTPPEGAADAAEGQGGGSAAAAAAGEGEQGGAAAAGGGGGDDDLVEYEGTLVSAAAAQRRRFFSSVIQRAAKMHRRLRGGSLTSLLVVPGQPASGRARRAREQVQRYRHLSEAQKRKLLAALEAAEAPPPSAQPAQPAARAAGPPQELRTEVVEEFMSIADGQVVLRAGLDGPTGGVSVDPQLSISRIGSRAYHPAVAALATQVRVALAQAEDAARFAAGGGAEAEGAARARRRAAVLAAAVPQPQRSVCPLEAQVAQLVALQRGMLDAVPPGRVAAALEELTARAAADCPDAMREIAETKRLTAESEAALVRALEAGCAALGRQAA
jgi:F-type H+-transporting ATPase subunit alpha